MDDAKRKQVEAMGGGVGDAADFLGLDPIEAAWCDLRARASIAVRRLRSERGWTQARLAEAMGSTQPKVARLEQSTRGVSLDQVMRAIYALGGTIADIGPDPHAPAPAPAMAAIEA